MSGLHSNDFNSGRGTTVFAPVDAAWTAVAGDDPVATLSEQPDVLQAVCNALCCRTFRLPSMHTPVQLMLLRAHCLQCAPADVRSSRQKHH